MSQADPSILEKLVPPPQAPSPPRSLSWRTAWAETRPPGCSEGSQSPVRRSLERTFHSKSERFCHAQSPTGPPPLWWEPAHSFLLRSELSSCFLLFLLTVLTDHGFGFLGRAFGVSSSVACDWVVSFHLSPLESTYSPRSPYLLKSHHTAIRICLLWHPLPRFHINLTGESHKRDCRQLGFLLQWLG